MTTIDNIPWCLYARRNRIWMTAMPHQLINPVTAVILKNQLKAAEALFPISIRLCSAWNLFSLQLTYILTRRRKQTQRLMKTGPPNRVNQTGWLSRKMQARFHHALNPIMSVNRYRYQSYLQIIRWYRFVSLQPFTNIVSGAIPRQSDGIDNIWRNIDPC